MAYREVRVRPVVRYLVTYHYTEDDDRVAGSSTQFGEFDDVRAANAVAAALGSSLGEGVVIEPARPLRIHWLRGPGEPKEAIRWELEDPTRPDPGATPVQPPPA